MSEPVLPSCPVCQRPLELAGRTYRCPSCRGAWIAEDTLVALVEQRAPTLVELPWQAREGSPRPCARCGAPMQTVNLGTVALDRCAAHGVWCDADELTALLEQAKQLRAPARAGGREAHHETLLRKLAKLLAVS